MSAIHTTRHRRNGGTSLLQTQRLSLQLNGAAKCLDSCWPGKIVIHQTIPHATAPFSAHIAQESTTQLSKGPLQLDHPGTDLSPLIICWLNSVDARFGACSDSSTLKFCWIWCGHNDEQDIILYSKSLIHGAPCTNPKGPVAALPRMTFFLLPNSQLNSIIMFSVEKSYPSHAVPKHVFRKQWLWIHVINL